MGLRERLDPYSWKTIIPVVLLVIHGVLLAFPLLSRRLPSSLYLVSQFLYRWTPAVFAFQGLQPTGYLFAALFLVIAAGLALRTEWGFAGGLYILTGTAFTNILYVVLYTSRIKGAEPMTLAVFVGAIGLYSFLASMLYHRREQYEIDVPQGIILIGFLYFSGAVVAGAVATAPLLADNLMVVAVSGALGLGFLATAAGLLIRERWGLLLFYGTTGLSIALDIFLLSHGKSQTIIRMILAIIMLSYVHARRELYLEP